MRLSELKKVVFDVGQPQEARAGTYEREALQVRLSRKWKVVGCVSWWLSIFTYGQTQARKDVLKVRQSHNIQTDVHDQGLSKWMTTQQYFLKVLHLTRNLNV